MIELVRKRRSCRSYTQQPIERPSLDLLLETLLRAPSSRNRNPWEFVVVDDAELLGRLSLAKAHGSAFLKGSPLGIVVCADETASDVWIEDCAIASILVQMTAESLGLGSCWIQIRERQHDAGETAESYVRALLGLPLQLRVAAIISIGHPSARREPLGADKLQYDKLKHNHYSRAFDGTE